MPALSTAAALGAMLIHSQVTVDSDPGIQVGETGLLINSLDVTPSREAKVKMDHLARKVMTLFTTPVWSLSLAYETTVNAALIPGSSPGTALTLGEVASLNPATAHGFPTDQGFLSVDSNTRNGKQGDLWSGTAGMSLCWLPTGDINVYRAA